MGMTLSTEIDTELLPAIQGQELDDAIKAAGFFNLPQEGTISDQGADRFEYEISITDKDRRHTVRLNEATISPSLKELLNRLTAIARSERLSKRN